MGNYKGTAQIRIDKVDVVVRNSCYIPFYQIRPLDNNTEYSVIGGCRIPKEDCDINMKVREERVFIHSFSLGLMGDCKPELDRFKDSGFEIITIDVGGAYTSIDCFDTEEGEKYRVGGSDYILGVSEKGIIF